MSVDDNMYDTGVQRTIQRFDNALARGEDYDLAELASAIKTEKRSDFLKQLISREIAFYRDKGWTYNLSLIHI